MQKMKINGMLVSLTVAFIALQGFGGSFLRKTLPIDQTAEAPAEVAAAPLFRKTMAIIGDSYVQNHRRPIEETWHYKLAAKYQMQYYNYGRNGNRLAISRDNKFGAPIIKRYGEMHTPADYVVVIAGHNDACAMKSAEAEDVELFRDSVRKLVAALRKKYPDAKLVFVSPWRNEGKGFEAVYKAYADILPQLGVHYYAAHSESGIDATDEATRAALFQSKDDKAHLNSQGHDKMLNIMEPWFLAL